jgi:hypothetical protein
MLYADVDDAGEDLAERPCAVADRHDAVECLGVDECLDAVDRTMGLDAAWSRPARP